MPDPYSPSEAQKITGAARETLKTIDGIIREQLLYALEIHSCYEELIGQSG